MKLALAVSGADESEVTVLEPLCAAALARWRARVHSDAYSHDCAEALACAAAFSAAADLAAVHSGISAFSAGEISVQLGKESGRAAELRKTAEALMAPFARPDDLFLRGVRG